MVSSRQTASASATITVARRRGAASDSRRRRRGEPNGSSRSRRPGPRATGRRRAARRRRARAARGASVTGLTPTWSFSPGDGQLDADGASSPTAPATITSPRRRPHARRAPWCTSTSATCGAPSPSSAGCRARLFPTSEVWIHPNGKVAYLGTHGGGDRVYAIDISDPGEPGDRRLDHGEHAARERHADDGRRQLHGASRARAPPTARTASSSPTRTIRCTRRRSPQFTDGVTAGVHSVYIYENPKYGKYVFLTNDGTGAIDIVDITDPAHPKRAGEWRHEPPRRRALRARPRHRRRPDVRELLERRAGHPRHRQRQVGRPARQAGARLAVQVRSRLAVPARSRTSRGAGFTRGTHTAWRQRGGNYVFIADEVYRNGHVEGAKDASSSRMYGTLQVSTSATSSIPKSVAWYTPEMRRRAQRLGGGRHALPRRLRRGLPRVRHLRRAQGRSPRAGPRDRVAQHRRHGRHHAERRVHVGRRGEPEGRSRVRERLQQRPVGRPRESEAEARSFRDAGRRLGCIGSCALRRWRGTLAAWRSSCNRDIRLPSSARHPPVTRPASRDYLVFVASEGNDRIALVRFGPDGARVERERESASIPTELARAARRRRVARRAATTTSPRRTARRTARCGSSPPIGDSLVGSVELGTLPGDGAGVARRRLRLRRELQPVRRHGAVVGVGRLRATRWWRSRAIPTCMMPHGSRLNPQGTKHYSACMMDDVLVEIDTRHARRRRATSCSTKGNGARA